MLYIEYATIERMRFEFLASHNQRPEQFTVCASLLSIELLHVEYFLCQTVNLYLLTLESPL